MKFNFSFSFELFEIFALTMALYVPSRDYDRSVFRNNECVFLLSKELEPVLQISSFLDSFRDFLGSMLFLRTGVVNFVKWLKGLPVLVLTL